MPDGSEAETSEFRYRLTFVLSMRDFPLIVEVKTLEVAEGVLDYLARDGKPALVRSSTGRLYLIPARALLYAYLDVVKVTREEYEPKEDQT